MSGWNPYVNGYAMLAAAEYGEQVAEAQRRFEAAMRADNGATGSLIISNAIRAHKQAIKRLETIKYTMDRIADGEGA